MSVTISALPSAQAITGDELVPVVQDGFTRRASVSDLVAPTSSANIATTVDNLEPAPSLSAADLLAIVQGSAALKASILEIITAGLPTQESHAGQVLTTDGDGNLSWVAQSSGGGITVLATVTPGEDPDASGTINPVDNIPVQLFAGNAILAYFNGIVFVDGGQTATLRVLVNGHEAAILENITPDTGPANWECTLFGKLVGSSDIDFIASLSAQGQQAMGESTKVVINTDTFTWAGALTVTFEWTITGSPEGGLYIGAGYAQVMRI